jgi:hypothetical protein
MSRQRGRDTTISRLLRRRAVRWLVAGLVTVVAAGVVVGGVLLSPRSGLDEQLNRRAVAALEQAPPTETSPPTPHAAHGRPANPDRRVDTDGHELRCVAKVFGHDPPGASSIDEVSVSYAHRMCAAIGPGLAWPASIRETGPVAVRLGTPDTLILPEKALPEVPDANYTDRIRAVIPERHHQQALAFADFVDPDVAEELRDRVEE